MPAKDFDAVFYVRAVPAIRYEDGLFHVGYDIGNRARFEVVLSPATFHKAMQCANRVSDEFHASCESKVVPLRSKH